jgi:hypothetical protein
VKDEWRQRSKAKLWGKRLVIGLALYAASWGPLVAAYDMGWLHNPAPDWLMTVYWPLDRMAEHQPAQLPMRFYWYFWLKIFKLF